jgi:hypothetical protein
VSKLGGGAAFAAEAAIWIAGVALIAGTAGMHWDADLQSALNELTGSTPLPATSAGASAGASVGASASPTAAVVVESLAPGVSPTLSPIVAKYQAYVARPDYQFKAKYTSVTTYTFKDSPYGMDTSGTVSYKAGDKADGHRETVAGAVTTYDSVDLGSVEYRSKNGGAWTKSARSASSAAADKLMLAPTMLFVDKGIEAKNGAPLHRLEVADAAAYSTAFLKTQTGATGAQATCTVWVADDGTPADFKIEGWLQAPIQGVSTKITFVMEFRIIATSGVTISAPI